MNETQPLIEYIPPKSEAIRAFARRVCEALATRTNDPIFTQPHVICGFAEFLEIAAQARAKYLNATQLVDNNEE